MAILVRKYTFDLSYNISIKEGHVNSDIVIPLLDFDGKVVIHPPKSLEKRYVFESPEAKVWQADKIEMEIEVNRDSRISTDELDTIVSSMAEEYLRTFLRYCRSEAKQAQIDLKQEPTIHVRYTDETGKERKEGYIRLSLPLGVPNALDDQSWNRVFQCIIKNAQIPFYQEALLDAKLYRSHNDYRMAVVTAAMGIESIIKRYMEKVLKQRLVTIKITSQRQVKKFIDEISNRLLITIGLGLTSEVGKDIAESCRNTMDIRNRIVHGEKQEVSSQEARKAIESLEELLSTTDIARLLLKEDKVNEKS